MLSYPYSGRKLLASRTCRRRRVPPAADMSRLCAAAGRRIYSPAPAFAGPALISASGRLRLGQAASPIPATTAVGSGGAYAGYNWQIQNNLVSASKADVNVSGQRGPTSAQTVPIRGTARCGPPRLRRRSLPGLRHRRPRLRRPKATGGDRSRREGRLDGGRRRRSGGHRQCRGARRGTATPISAPSNFADQARRPTPRTTSWSASASSSKRTLTRPELHCDSDRCPVVARRGGAFHSG